MKLININFILMINNFPVDILIKIYDYIDPITLLSLKNVDKKLYYNILSIEKYVLLKELREINNDVTNFKKLYNWFEIFFRSIYENQKSYIFSNLFNSKLRSNGMFIREIIINNIKKNYLHNNSVKSNNNCSININLLFKKLYLFFLENECDNNDFVMSTYQNNIELFIFYKIYEISINKSTSNISSNIKFLNDLQNYSPFGGGSVPEEGGSVHEGGLSNSLGGGKTEINYLGYFHNFDNVKNISIDYYNYIYSNNLIVKFEDLYNMSSVATTLCSLKKIFGYKVLNLSNTILLPYFDEYNSQYLFYLTSYRFNRKYDDLICHNYNEIKYFFYRTNTIFYNEMIYNEKIYVNKQISVLNPKTNKIIKINDIINLTNSNTKTGLIYDDSVYKFIKYNQEKLLKKYFC